MRRGESCHQLINILFLFPSTLCFKVIFFSPLLFSLYFPYQSILIIGHLTLPLSLAIYLCISACLSSLSLRQKERGKRTDTQTHTHTMKSFICPIKEAEAHRKVNIHLSLSPSLSICLSFTL